MEKSRFLIAFIFFCLLTYLGCVLAIHDTNQQLNALNFLKPLVDSFILPAEVFYRVGHHWHEYCLLGVMAALGLLGCFGVSGRQRCFVLSVLCAVSGQFLLSNFNAWRFLSFVFSLIVPNSLEIPASEGLIFGIGLGLCFYALSLVLALRAFKDEQTFTASEKGRSEGEIFGAREWVILSGIFGVALVLRMYALNVVVDVFEGELAAFSAGATSIQGMFIANKGTGGPWAPLGILYYVPIYIATKLFGTTLIALRLSSAIVGVLTVPLIYLLASRLGGRLAGYIAAALFSLNILHIGWSRTDVHPHGVTTWPTVLLCLALIKAYDSRRLLWAAVVAFLMGLSWHQYPSGQSAVLIPFMAIGFFWLNNQRTLPLSKSACGLIGLGLVVWFMGFPFSNYLADGSMRFLNPFTLTGPRASWSSDNLPHSKLGLLWLVGSSTLAHVSDVLQGLFFKQKFMCHQEWLHPTQGTFMRTVPWLEMPFVFLGVVLLVRFRRRFETAVMVGWLVAAILPGVLSEQAYPKRLSTFYPALDVLAALALATLVYYRSSAALRSRRLLVSGIAIALIGYASFAGHFWFSGKWWKYQEPSDVPAAARIAQAIRPDTIVINYMNEGYDRAKYLYLLLDHLAGPSNRPNMWVGAFTPDIKKLIAEPLSSGDVLDKSIPYSWTKLRNQLQETKQHNSWKRVVFVLQSPGPYYRVDEAIIDAASKRCAHPKIEKIDAPKPLILIECEINDLL